MEQVKKSSLDPDPPSHELSISAIADVRGVDFMNFDFAAAQWIVS